MPESAGGAGAIDNRLRIGDKEGTLREARAGVLPKFIQWERAMRYRMLALFVSLVLAAGCGPSEPVQEEMAPNQSSAPQGGGPLLEPEPKPDAEPESMPAQDQPALVEPRTQPAQEPAEPEPTPLEEPSQPTPQEQPQPDPKPALDEPQAAAPAEQPAEDKPEETKQPLELAIDAVQSGDFGTAKGHLSSVLKDDPTNRDALSLLTATQLYEAMQHEQFGEIEKANPLYLESSATLDKLQETHPELASSPQLASLVSRVRFEASRSHARGGKADEAIAMLQAAVDAGLDNVDVLNDQEDFDGVRERAEFKAIVDNLQQKLVERAEAEAKELLATHEPFEFDFSLQNLDGETVSLADYKGKVLVVDIWGTWCPPCRKEIPHLVELHKTYRDEGFEIVGINDERNLGISAEEAPPVIREFAKEHGITYTCVIATDEVIEQVPDFQGFPTTLFIDRAGKVRAKAVGYRPYANLEAIVKQLLSEETGEAAQGPAGAGE